MPERVANMIAEIAVVGPEIITIEDPQSAATTAVTIAVYRPNSGGRPAIIAKATPCGKTIAALVKPARASALSDAGVVLLAQCSAGKSVRAFKVLPQY